MRPRESRVSAGPLCVALFMLTLSAASPHQARGGMITVLGDVSAQNNFSFFDAVLGNQSSVVFSRGAVQQPTLRTHWDQLPGVSAIESSAVLTPSFLSTVDLLVVTTNFSEPLDYTASEIGAVGQFVEGGGIGRVVGVAVAKPLRIRLPVELIHGAAAQELRRVFFRREARSQGDQRGEQDHGE